MKHKIKLLDVVALTDDLPERELSERSGDPALAGRREHDAHQLLVLDTRHHTGRDHTPGNHPEGVAARGREDKCELETPQSHPGL